MAPRDAAPARAESNSEKKYAARIEVAKACIHRSEAALKRSHDLLEQSRSALAASRKRPSGKSTHKQG